MSSKHEPRETTGMEIAVIGMAGRFPGARDVDEFWNNVAAGRESLRELTDEELEEAGVPASVYRRDDFIRVVRNMDDPELFDAAFFDISPREAELLDPQHRVFLEQAWEALEDGGYDPDRIDRPVGVFGGARMNGYLIHFLEEILSSATIQVQIANDKDYIATRVSYKLNLGGPSMAVQTACSTGLVAVHMACQSLIAGECDMALAGATSIRTLDQGYLYREGDVGAPDGRIRAFDAKAQGTIFGNGSGMVLLKRLEDAVADGDNVAAVILGSGVTNDGNRKVGFTAPSVDGQARAVRAALEVAEIHPEQISYVEAHGTGTPLGDPIEIEALTRVYREYTEETGFCRIGSVKSNIGHLSAASGVAGLIKLAQALRHEELPPSINFEQPNPAIDFDHSPFRVNAETSSWERGEVPRRAGVSAFGMGGTNAHVVVQEAPEREPSEPATGPQVLVLSARSDEALGNLGERLARRLETAADTPEGEPSLADVAYTLESGRRRQKVRRAVVAQDLPEAVAALRGEGGRSVTGRAAGKPPAVAFLFPGQGAQHPHMAHGLYRSEPVFRRTVDRCAELLREPLGLDLREALFPAPGAEEEAARTLEDTRITQPALFTVEVALAALWRSWGIEPAAMMGHSVGEYAAATVAGVWSLEDGLRLIAERGRLMASLPAGSMLAVPRSEEETAAHLGPELSVAALNAPGRTVVSGPSEAIDELARRLEGEGIRSRPLHTSHAFHSPMMEPILRPFVEAFEGVTLSPPQIPFVSNLSGSWITADEATDPSYWARHLRGAVRFADGLATLLGADDDDAETRRLLLEVGPGTTLTALARRHPAVGDVAPTASLPHPKEAGEEGAEDHRATLAALGRLWCAGVEIDWDAVRSRGEQNPSVPRRVSLPTYPFERRRYWVPLDLKAALGGGTGATGPVAKTENLDDWFHLPVWKPGTPPALDPSGLDAAGRWLVILDPAGLGQAVVDRLEADGRDVTAVAWHADLASGRDAWDRLLADWRGDAPEGPESLVYLGTFDGDADDALAADPRGHVDRGFWSLLWLGQALGVSAGEEAPPVRLAVVSDLLQQAPGDGRVAPGKATLVGPARVLPREIPHLRLVSLDLPAAASGAETDRWAARLIAETLAATAEPTFVAHRRDPATGAVVRWRWGFEASPLGPPAVPAGDDGNPLRLDDESVVLVTGGLGGLGLTFARYLAESHRARLVLTSRSGLPPREEWPEHLREAAADDSTAARIRQVRALEAAGAEVLVAAADVADRDAMAQVVAAARERFGGIDGVIHTAGIPGGGLVQLKTREAAAKVLDPKIEGTLVLEDVLRDAPPRWTVLCSSTLAVLGSPGQVDYCAANNFLDAFARDRTAAGGPYTLSVGWGAWEEVGMAVAAGITSGGAADLQGDEPQNDLGELVTHPLLARRRRLDDGGWALTAELSPETCWILDEHRILGTPALPGTSHLEIAAAAYRELTGSDRLTLSDVVFFTPLMVDEGSSRFLEARLLPTGDDDRYRFEIRSRPAAGGDWTDHARGKVAPAEGEATAPDHGAVDLGAIRQRLEPMAVPDWDDYAHTGDAEADAGKLVLWGDHWRTLQEVYKGDGEGLALLELPESFATETRDFVLHPALLDVATALASALYGESYLPLSYRRVRVAESLPARFHSHLRQVGGTPGGGETVTVDLSLVDDDGRTVVAVEGFVMKRVGAAAGRLAGGGAARPNSPSTPEVDVTAAGILPAEGVEALRRLLARDFAFPWVAVSARDLTALERQVAASRARAAERGDTTTHERPNLDSDYVAPRNDVEERLATIWQSCLGLDRVGVEDNFFELGGDSVVGIEVISAAQEQGLELAPDQLFEHQTVAELAAALAGSGESGETGAPAAGETAGEGTPVDEAAADLSDADMDAVLAQLGGLP